MIEHPQYTRGNLYLSGGMQYAKDLGASWRIEASQRLKSMKYYPIDITVLDKIYSSTFGHPYMFLETTDLLQYKSNIRRQIVRADVELVKQQSHGMIVYFDSAARNGAGTQSECQVAYDNEIPYFLVRGLDTWHDVPGWIRANSTKMFDTFDELYDYLDKLPFAILKKDVYGNLHSGTHYLCSLCGDPFEKQKTHFVSKVSPLYCKPCVEVVKKTHEQLQDRYEFFIKHLQQEIVTEQFLNLQEEVKTLKKSSE